MYYLHLVCSTNFISLKNVDVDMRSKLFRSLKCKYEN